MWLKTNFRINKRNIKTAIAVFLSVLISHLLKLQSPFFAAIAVIFSMENSLYTSYMAGLYRMYGTIIGAVVGIIFVLIHPNSAILCGVGTIAFIAICDLFHIERTVPTAGVVFAAIMLSLDNKNPLNYSLNRILDTFVGIVIAIVISYIIFPKENIKKIRRSIRSITEKIREASLNFISTGKESDFNGLKEELLDYINLLNIYKKEFDPKRQNPEMLEVTSDMELLRQILKHLDTIYELKTQSKLNEENIKKLTSFGITNISMNKDYDNQTSLIYNYHVDKLLNSLNCLKASV